MNERKFPLSHLKRVKNNRMLCPGFKKKREIYRFGRNLKANFVPVEFAVGCQQACQESMNRPVTHSGLTDFIYSAPLLASRCRSYKSVDGRTTPSLSGTNPSTPQPSSPDTGHFHLLQDYGPVPSPLSPPSPDTPCSRDAHTPSSRDSYTPHTRDAHRPVYSEDTRCSTPDFAYEERVSKARAQAGADR